MSKSSRLKKDLDNTIAQARGFLHEFQAETDRGTTVVAASYLDDLLASMLRRRFIEQAKIVDTLLDFQGPLGTFSSRIDLTYCLGLIREDQYKDLSIVRRIRNEFAHSHQALTFDSQPVCDLCDNLQQLVLVGRCRDQMPPEIQKLLLDQFQTRREKFTGNVLHLAMGITLRCTDIKHAVVGREAVATEENISFDAGGHGDGGEKNRVSTEKGESDER